MNETFVNTCDRVGAHSELLSGRLQSLRTLLYPPDAEKSLRLFSTGEAAKLIGVHPNTLKMLSADNKGPVPQRLANNHRAYSLAQINELRQYFADAKPKRAHEFVPHRRDGEHLQIIANANFKGGSAKTTTSVHLIHYLAIRGYRVLAIDLDPQASLTSLFGLQSEFDVKENESVYGALRYDDEQRPISELRRPTYFAGVDLVPGNLEIMDFEHDSPRMLMTPNQKPTLPFFARLRGAIKEVEADYDIVVLDTPPNLGYVSMNSVFAATGLIITIHPAMLDVASMNQFLKEMYKFTSTVRDKAGVDMDKDFIKYLITRHNTNDEPQEQIVAMLRGLFPGDVFEPTTVESTAVGAAGLKKRSVYEVESDEISPATQQRARDSMNAVNDAILKTIHRAWGRS